MIGAVTPASAALAVVGIADLKVSAAPGERLVTYALGSCLGITVHDPVAGVGGLLHVMLPDSSIDPDTARRKPFTFVDTGVPRLFRACYELGARKERMVLKVAGGARVGDDRASDHFEIGRRNALMLRKLLWKNNVVIAAEDVGGQLSRTMSLEIGSGIVALRIAGADSQL